jgi:hypothetical protein
MSKMPAKLNKIKIITPYLDVISKVLQIIALLCAGAWAIWTWNQTIAPGLHTGLLISVDTTTTWNQTSNACLAELDITIENAGPKSIAVARAEYELVKASSEMLDNANDVKIIGTLPSKTEQLAQGDFEHEFIVNTYAPKSKAEQSLTVLISPKVKKEIWYRVELFDQNNESLARSYGRLEPCKRNIKNK